MRSILILLVVGMSLQSFAAPERETQGSDFFGNALVGFGAGTLGAVVLLVKDSLCGVVVKGGREYHGKDRILPLVLLVGITTLIAGAAGHMNKVNFLDAFWE